MSAIITDEKASTSLEAMYTISILRRPCQWSCQSCTASSTVDTIVQLLLGQMVLSLQLGASTVSHGVLGWLLANVAKGRSLLFLNMTLSPTKSPFAYFLGQISQHYLCHNQLPFFHCPASFLSLHMWQQITDLQEINFKGFASTEFKDFKDIFVVFNDI